MKNDTPTLGYWPIQARGDPCRLLLFYLGVEFKDKMYDFGDESDQGWANQKEKLGMVFPNLPYWQHDDIIHSETVPILRSICRKFGHELLGRNEKEQAYADSFVGTIYGGFPGWLGPYMFAPGYAERKEEGLQAAKEYLKTINDCLGGKRFLAGNEVTYADFITYWILKILTMYDSGVLNSFSNLVQYMETFRDLKGIKQCEEKYAKYPPFPMTCAWQADHPHTSALAFFSGQQETPGNPEPEAGESEALKRMARALEAYQQGAARSDMRKMSSMEKFGQAGQKKQTNIGVSCGTIAFIIVIAVILSEYDGDCDTPIRLWLTVYMIVLCVHSGLLIIGQILMSISMALMAVTGFALMILNLLVALFYFVWFIVGNVWYFDIDSCDDFEEGYILTLVLLILMYLTFTCCCCAICCITVFGVLAAKKQAEAIRRMEEERIDGSPNQE